MKDGEGSGGGLNKVVIPKITKSTNLRNHFTSIRKEFFNRVKYETILMFPSFFLYLRRVASCFCFCFYRASSESISLSKLRQELHHRQQLLEEYRRKHSSGKKVLSYHELLNISLKFLISV